MGKGQRHSKNAGVMGSESLTYAERRGLGFGTVKERLGKEPVITPEGYLFSKEAILENLLEQKKTIKRKTAAWEAQQAEEDQKAVDKAAVECQAKLIAFDRQNHMGISETTAHHIKSAIEEEAASMHEHNKGAKAVVAIAQNEERIKHLKAFWMPQQTQDNKITLQKPPQDTFCPASGKKLRLKDLIPVRFTRVPDDDAGLYMDPVTRETLTNSQRLVVLKPTGDVMLLETYNKCVKPEGRYEGTRVRDPQDVIPLRTGGSGFADRDGESLEAKKAFTLGPGSGLADLRGQHHGPRSLGGLQFWN